VLFIAEGNIGTTTSAVVHIAISYGLVSLNTSHSVPRLYLISSDAPISHLQATYCAKGFTHAFNQGNDGQVGHHTTDNHTFVSNSAHFQAIVSLLTHASQYCFVTQSSAFCPIFTKSFHHSCNPLCIKLGCKSIHFASKYVQNIGFDISFIIPHIVFGTNPTHAFVAHAKSSGAASLLPLILSSLNHCIIFHFLSIDNNKSFGVTHSGAFSAIFLKSVLVKYVLLISTQIPFFFSSGIVCGCCVFCCCVFCGLSHLLINGAGTLPIAKVVGQV
jgi:hypothetical protein